MTCSAWTILKVYSQPNFMPFAGFVSKDEMSFLRYELMLKAREELEIRRLSFIRVFAPFVSVSWAGSSTLRPGFVNSRLKPAHESAEMYITVVCSQISVQEILEIITHRCCLE